MKDKAAIIIAGLVLGVLSVLLVKQGNPLNMGFCIACFLRDIAGGLGLHRAAVVQYLRPEIMGLILGATVMAVGFREHRSTGGSSPVLRFFIGFIMMVGALVFLGCPLRMILRMAGGDANAFIALPGYVAGIWVGVVFLKRGFSLGRSSRQHSANGAIAPLIALVLLAMVVINPPALFTSTEGPGSMQAPLLLALGAGLLVGILAQRTRFCTMGAVRDIILFRDFHLFAGIAAVFVVVLAGNLALGMFTFGFDAQPVAHTGWLWNFLGMSVVGLAAVLAGGCPLRQLILAGQGDTDGMATVLGMATGAAIAHNFGLTSSPAGASANGQIAVFMGLAVLIAIGVFSSRTLYKGFATKNESERSSF